MYAVWTYFKMFSVVKRLHLYCLTNPLTLLAHFKCIRTVTPTLLTAPFVHYAVCNCTIITFSTRLKSLCSVKLILDMSLSVCECRLYVPLQLQVSPASCSNTWRRKHIEARVNMMREHVISPQVSCSNAA